MLPLKTLSMPFRLLVPICLSLIAPIFLFAQTTLRVSTPLLSSLGYSNACTPDGKYFLNSAAEIWDISANGIIKNIPAPDHKEIYSYASIQKISILSEKNQALIIWTNALNQVVTVETIDLTTFKSISKKDLNRKAQTIPTNLKLSPNGQYLFLEERFDKTTFEVWDIGKDKPKMLRSFKNDEEYYMDGGSLTDDFFWLERGQINKSDDLFEAYTLPNFKKVDSKAISHAADKNTLSNNKVVFTDGYGDGLVIIDYTTGQESLIWKTGEILRAPTCNNNNQFVAFKLDGEIDYETKKYTKPMSIKVFDLEQKKELSSFPIHGFKDTEGHKIDLVFSHDGTKLCVLGTKNKEQFYEIWDWKNTKKLHEEALPSMQYSHIVFKESTPKNQWFIGFNHQSCSTVAVINGQAPYGFSLLGQANKNDVAKTASYLKSIDLSQTYNYKNINISNDGKYINIISPKGVSKLWDGKTQKLINEWQIKKLPSDVFISVFSPSGDFLTQYSPGGLKNKTATIYQASTGKEIAKIKTEKTTTAFYFTGDSGYLVSYELDDPTNPQAKMNSTVWSTEDFKVLTHGPLNDIMKKYPIATPELSALGLTSFGSPTTREKILSLISNPLQKGIIVLTMDNRFGGYAEDLAYVYEVKDKTITRLNNKDPRFLKDFLYGALDKNRSENPIQSRKDYALLFAMEDYEDGNGWKDLGNPVYDAESLGETLKNDYGFEVEIVKNSSQAVVKKKLREYYKMEYGPNDQLVVFYSGHGQKDPDYEEEGYFVPVDGSADALDIETCISHQDFMRRIDNIPCEHILLVADACYSGKMSNYGELRRNKEKYDRGGFLYRGKTDEQYLEAKLKDKSRIFFASGSDVVPDGIAGRHTPFMKFLLDALEKNRGDMRFLSIGVLKEDVEWVGITTPVYGDFGKGMATGNFIFVKQKR